MDGQGRTIQRNRVDLMRIVAALWTMAGLGSRNTILRSMRLLVKRMLRPAEAAVRRLIVVLARDVVIVLRPSRPRKPGARRVRAAVRTIAFALTDPNPLLDWASAAPRGFGGIAVKPDGPVPAGPLAMRIDALLHALEDMDAQAKRMARWQALRRRARERGAYCATRPLRPGPPPDLRGRAARRLRKHALHGLLRDIHAFAWWAVNAPDDTS